MSILTFVLMQLIWLYPLALFFVAFRYLTAAHLDWRMRPSPSPVSDRWLTRAALIFLAGGPYLFWLYLLDHKMLAWAAFGAGLLGCLASDVLGHRRRNQSPRKVDLTGFGENAFGRRPKHRPF